MTYARYLGSIAPRGNKLASGLSDLSRLNPDLQAQNALLQSGMMGGATPARGGRELALGLAVTVIKGPHKTYKGIIKDLNGQLARVELHTNMKTITIERNKLGAIG